MALVEVQRKIAHYRRRIRGLKRKYDTDFETFSARLQERATPAEEDDWLAWRSAYRMLADWQETYEKLSALPLYHSAPPSTEATRSIWLRKAL